ncbi:MAG: amidohydrolase family protein, partial [Holophagales bacterium]|nr:amidohydrolase family protein [Holophagales bacterium]
MRSSRARSILVAASLALSLPLLAAPAHGGGDVAIRGERVHTVAGEVIENGVVVVRNGKIEAVGPAGEVAVPEGLEVLEAAVVTPGLVDAHSVVGFSGYLNQDHDQDQLERSSPVQPELRAIDAYNAREPLVEWVRDFGVTTLHTGHGPGAVISGQTMIVKTRGDTVEQAVVKEAAMVAVTLGDAGRGGRRGGGPAGWPGTRAKATALLRAKLIAAQEYAKKVDEAEEGKAPARDLSLEILSRVLRGELPLLVTVHRHRDIMTALRLQQEFGFELVLDGAAEAYTLLDEIRQAGVPVVVHPTMMRPVGEAENLTLENAALLADAGIPIALQSGFEAYVPKTRVVLFEAGVAAARGLGFDRALESVTLGAARILGIDDRVGSLEVGKDADLVLWS